MAKGHTWGEQTPVVLLETMSSLVMPSRAWVQGPHFDEHHLILTGPPLASKAIALTPKCHHIPKTQSRAPILVEISTCQTSCASYLLCDFQWRKKNPGQEASV